MKRFINALLLLVIVTVLIGFVSAIICSRIDYNKSKNKIKEEKRGSLKRQVDILIQMDSIIHLRDINLSKAKIYLNSDSLEKYQYYISKYWSYSDKYDYLDHSYKLESKRYELKYLRNMYD